MRPTGNRLRRFSVLSRTAAALLTFLIGMPYRPASGQAEKSYRIGYLSERSAAVEKDRIAAFEQGLRQLGYKLGQDLIIEYRRTAAGERDKLRTYAAELVQLKVDVIVASSGSIVPVAKEATSTIPIVFTVAADPVEDGLVQSLARPGGNITGFSDLHSTLVTKRLELIKEIIPSLSRIAVLLNRSYSVHHRQLKEIEDTVPAFGVKLFSFPVTKAMEIESAFKDMSKTRSEGVMVLGDPLVGGVRPQIVAHALRNRLPTIFTVRESAFDGGLLAYGTNHTELWRRTARYVDKILKGTKPAELPVEQPTKFEFVINLKTAKQIGLTIPPHILARADQVIR